MYVCMYDITLTRTYKHKFSHTGKYERIFNDSQCGYRNSLLFLHYLSQGLVVVILCVTVIVLHIQIQFHYIYVLFQPHRCQRIQLSLSLLPLLVLTAQTVGPTNRQTKKDKIQHRYTCNSRYRTTFIYKTPSDTEARAILCVHPHYTIIITTKAISFIGFSYENKHIRYLTIHYITTCLYSTASFEIVINKE